MSKEKSQFGLTDGWSSCAVAVHRFVGAAAVVLAIGAAANSAWGQQTATLAGAQWLRLESCYVQLIDDVDVPARETGPLIELQVREGQAVGASQPLAKIDDQIVRRKQEEAMARLRAAEKKAGSTVEIEYSQAAYDVAAKEYEINRSLRSKGSVSLLEFEKSALAKREAELSIEKTRNELDIEQLNADAQRVELEAVNDAVVRHQIVSPIDGNVLKIHKQAGEWVQAGEKVLQIVRMNRLRVQGFIEADNFDPHEIDGRAVSVQARLARGRIETFAGRIVFVDLEKRGGSQHTGGSRYEIWAEVDNRSENDHWLLLPGSEVDLAIDLSAASIASGTSESTR
jgi:multidrug resistance efflux pump